MPVCPDTNQQYELYSVYFIRLLCFETDIKKDTIENAMRLLFENNA